MLKAHVGFMMKTNFELINSIFIVLLEINSLKFIGVNNRVCSNAFFYYQLKKRTGLG